MGERRPVAGFVVLHYLALVSTLSCVVRILRQEDAGFDVRVVVVDNASPDDSGRRLQVLLSDEPQVDVLRTEENLGFARGNNVGYRHLLENYDPEFVVVLNNDVMLERDFLRQVAREHGRSPFAVLGPDIFVPATGEHQSPSHVSMPTEAALERMYAGHDATRATIAVEGAREAALSGYRTVRHAAGNVLRKTPLAARIWPDRGTAATSAPQAQPHELPQESVILHGACYVFSREFTKARADAFCPDTFLYLEEDILGYECLRDGLAMRYEPSIRVIHQEDAATNLAHPRERDRKLLKRREKGRSAGILLQRIGEDRARVMNEGEIVPAEGASCTRLGAGYASRAINGAAFRRGAIATHRDEAGAEHCFCAFADPRGRVVLAARHGESDWELHDTALVTDVHDAHNAVSLSVDGAGFVHLAWSQHNAGLTCLRSTEPLSCELELMEVPGTLGGSITYPEFHLQPSGDLLLLYRTGVSGRGGAGLARYRCATGAWEQLFAELLRGEDESPYWQACVDGEGRLHLSWCLRASSDATTNHDLFYMAATDATCTQFADAQGRPVKLPARVGSISPVWEIPQGSGLVNQTSMTVMQDGTPVVASIWREGGIMQYQLLMPGDDGWTCCSTGIRSTDFPLAGRGTRRMGCARPQVLAQGARHEGSLLLLMRDDERGGVASAAIFHMADGAPVLEGIRDLTETGLGAWEPSCDVPLWQRHGSIRLLVQRELGVPDNREFPAMASPVFVLDATV